MRTTAVLQIAKVWLQRAAIASGGRSDFCRFPTRSCDGLESITNDLFLLLSTLRDQERTARSPEARTGIARMKGKRKMQTESFVRPDERLTSFTSLLKAPPSSSVHLALLDDNTLYGSIAYYLSGLEEGHVGPFAGVLANSGSFWAASTQTSAQTTGTQRPSLPPLLVRATNLSRAVAQATTRRADLLLKLRLGSIGWGTRRRLSNWVSSIVSACQLDIAASVVGPIPPELQHLDGQPVARLSILTGLLLGLNAVREQHKGSGIASSGLSVRSPLRKVEDEWIVAMSECLEISNRVYAPPAQISSQEEEGTDAWEREFKKREVGKALPDWKDPTGKSARAKRGGQD